MFTGKSTTLVETARRASIALGLCVFAAGLLGLIGWGADLPRLTDWENTGISIQPHAALAGIATGAALALLGLSHRTAAALLGAIAGLLGATALFEYLSGVDLGIDTILLFDRTWGHAGTLSTGRMGLPGATSWALLGTALALTRFGPTARRIAARLTVIAIAIASLSLTGYLLGADRLFTLPRLTTIAFQTATMIFAAGVALLLALPDRQPARGLLEQSVAGLLARRALPLIIIIPVGLALLRLKGQDLGLYDTRMGAALFVLAIIVLMCGGLWWAIGIVASSERALRENEERFRLLADAMPQIVYVTRADGDVEFVNQQWLDYTGQASAQATDLPVVVHPDDLGDLLARWREAMAAGVGLAGEFRLRRASDGAYRWFLTRAVPVRNEAGDVVRWYGTSTDIDDQKVAQTLLTEADRRKDEFLATLAHELRNPLAPLRNSVALLKHGDVGAAELAQARSAMERQVDRLVRLIDDLLDVSRITRATNSRYEKNLSRWTPSFVRPLRPAGP